MNARAPQGEERGFEVAEPLTMSASRIVLVRMGGGYLKAILPHRRETVFGRDDGELAGRLKLLGIRLPIAIAERKRQT